MAYQQKSTIADDLRTYKECSGTDDPHGWIADHMELSAARISQFSNYWKAVKSRQGVSRTLHRVILLHNGDGQYRYKDPFGFDKVYKFLELNKMASAKFSPAEQDSTLEAALGKAAQDATDAELLRLCYSNFERAIKELRGER